LAQSLRFLDTDARDKPVSLSFQLLITLRHHTYPFHGELLQREKKRPADYFRNFDIVSSVDREGSELTLARIARTFLETGN
jgi:hypothetical protein